MYPFHTPTNLGRWRWHPSHTASSAPPTWASLPPLRPTAHAAPTARAPLFLGVFTLPPPVAALVVTARRPALAILSGCGIHRPWLDIHSPHPALNNVIKISRRVFYRVSIVSAPSLPRAPGDRGPPSSSAHIDRPNALGLVASSPFPVPWHAPAFVLPFVNDHLLNRRTETDVYPVGRARVIFSAN